MEYESEPVEGLPEHLPDGEKIIWQGGPEWRSFAIHAFHVRKIAIYLGLLISWAIWSEIVTGIELRELWVSISWYLLMAATCLGLLLLLARAYARSTLYTMTNHRLVIRFGVALPMMINIPLKKLARGELQLYRDGTGNIALHPQKGCKVSFMMLWPNVRPWHWNPVQPCLRAIPDAAQVAERLAQVFGQRFETPRSVASDPRAAPTCSSLAT